jgi:hypothetical protein
MMQSVVVVVECSASVPLLFRLISFKRNTLKPLKTKGFGGICSAVPLENIFSLIFVFLE